MVSAEVGRAFCFYKGAAGSTSQPNDRIVSRTLRLMRANALLGLSNRRRNPHGAERFAMDREWLQQKYWQEELTPAEMAKSAGCSKRTILAWMAKLGVPRRTISENRVLAWRRGSYDSREYRAKIGKATSDRGKTIEGKEQLSRSAKLQMERPGQRQKIADGVRRAWQRGDFDGVHDRPDLRADKSRRTKDAWERGVYANQNYSQKRSGIMKRQWARGDFEGRYDNTEYKQSLSRQMHQRWASGEMVEIFRSPEFRAKASENTLARWKRGDFDLIFRAPTTIELEITDALDQMGIEHVAQYRPKGYSRIFDEYIPPNVLIEINGDYWHANPEIYGPNTMDDGQRERLRKDAEKRAWAEQHGFYLLVIWEKDIHKYSGKTILQDRLLPLLEAGNE